MNTFFTYLTGATKTKPEQHQLDEELNQLSQRGSEFQEASEETKSQKMQKQKEKLKKKEQERKRERTSKEKRILKEQKKKDKLEGLKNKENQGENLVVIGDKVFQRVKLDENEKKKRKETREKEKKEQKQKFMPEFIDFEMDQSIEQSPGMFLEEEEEAPKKHKKKEGERKKSTVKTAVAISKHEQNYLAQKFIGRLPYREIIRIISFLNLTDLMYKGILINKAIKKNIIKNSEPGSKYLRWNQYNQLENLSSKYQQKSITFHFTQQYLSLFEQEVKIKKFFKRIQLLVSLTDVCVLEIDSKTFKISSILSKLSKFLVDTCIGEQREIHLKILVDSKIDYKDVKNFLTLPVGGDIKDKDDMPSYFEQFKKVHLCVGELNYSQNLQQDELSSENDSKDESLYLKNDDELDQQENDNQDIIKEEAEQNEQSESEVGQISENKEKIELLLPEQEQEQNKEIKAEEQNSEEQEVQKPEKDEISENNSEAAYEGGMEIPAKLDLSRQVNQLINLFSYRYAKYLDKLAISDEDKQKNKEIIRDMAIPEVILSRQPSYDGPLLYNKSMKNKTIPAKGTKIFTFDTEVFDPKRDTYAILNAFPHLTDLIIKSENTLECCFDFYRNNMKYLKRVHLVTKKSNNFSGVINEDEKFFMQRVRFEKLKERPEQPQFEVKLTKEQRQRIKINVNLEQLGQQNVSYILKNFGVRARCKALRVIVKNLKINQQGTQLKYWGDFALQQSTADQDFSSTLSKAKIGSGFRVFDFLRKRLIYKLQQFTKQAKGRYSPYEITYQREFEKKGEHEKKTIQILAKNIEMFLQF